MVEAFKKQCGITSLRDIFPEPLLKKDIPEKSFVPSVDETKIKDIPKIYRPKDEDLKDEDLKDETLQDQDLNDSAIRKETKELHVRSPLDISNFMQLRFIYF